MKIKPVFLFLLAAAVASAPVWIVRHPPLTDLPYHVATIRVFHSLHDPAFGMDRFLTLSFSRTQYILYYGVGSLLANVVGVAHANTLLVSVYLSGTVLAVRELLVAFGRDPRACLFVIPLLPNRLFMIGLLPFLVGIPLLFWGIALAYRSFADPTPARRIGVGLMAFALFFTHVVPFALFLLGVAAVFPWRSPGRARAAAPILPALALAAGWLLLTDAGRVTQVAANPAGGGVRSLHESLVDLPNWVFHVFRDDSDRLFVIAGAAVAVASLALGWKDRPRGPWTTRAYVALPAVCAVAYFVLPDGADFVWPIAERFVPLTALALVPLMWMPKREAGVAITAAIAFVSFLSVRNVCTHFIDFERLEVGSFERVLAKMPPGKKVCTLIFEPGSSIIYDPAFLHFGSYYQAEKGGVVMFSFAGYPHWPVDFKPGEAPPARPEGAPRWEWVPESVSLEGEVYPYYDYVLVRGADFHAPPEMYGLLWSDGPWHLWLRADLAPPST